MKRAAAQPDVACGGPAITFYRGLKGPDVSSEKESAADGRKIEQAIQVQIDKQAQTPISILNCIHVTLLKYVAAHHLKT